MMMMKLQQIEFTHQVASLLFLWHPEVWNAARLHCPGASSINGNLDTAQHPLNFSVAPGFCPLESLSFPQLKCIVLDIPRVVTGPINELVRGC